MTAGYVSFKVHIDIFVCVRCWSHLHFKVTSLTRLVLFDVRQQKLFANCFETVSNLCRAWLYRMDEVKSAPKFATTCTNKCGRPFGHNRHGPKRGRCAPFRGGRGLGPHLTQCGWGWGLPAYQVAFWSIQPFGHNRHGPKIGELGPHQTQCGQGRGLPPCQVSSRSIQPFCCNTPMFQTDRTTVH